MLSILIPTYNYNVVPLVLELHKQCLECKIEFEIICLDDGSQSELNQENKKINTLAFCSFQILEKNIGRSAIRNLLASKAQYNWLLFLDSDVLPKSKKYISNYISYMDNEVKIVNGGILYQEERPQNNKILRWVYGKKREALEYKTRSKNPYLSSLTLNFLIHQSVFEKVRFNESIPNLRHEDTLFSYNLKQENIKIVHIDNPIYHYGLDPFEKAIQKEKESLSALKYLIDNKLLPAEYVGISRVMSKIKRFQLILFFIYFHKTTRVLFLKNLASNAPSLFLFDLYRLGYLCQLYKKKC